VILVVSVKSLPGNPLKTTGCGEFSVTCAGCGGFPVVGAPALPTLMSVQRIPLTAPAQNLTRLIAVPFFPRTPNALLPRAR
jgi:hypothetical protein